MEETENKKDRIPSGVKRYTGIEFKLEDGYSSEEVIHLCECKGNSVVPSGEVENRDRIWWSLDNQGDICSPFVVVKQDNIVVVGNDYLNFVREDEYTKFESNLPGTTYIPKDAISHSINGVKKSVNMNFKSSESFTYSIEERAKDILKQIKHEFRRM